jgi:hypothetical protein
LVLLESVLLESMLLESVSAVMDGQEIALTQASRLLRIVKAFTLKAFCGIPIDRANSFLASLVSPPAWEWYFVMRSRLAGESPLRHSFRHCCKRSGSNPSIQGARNVTGWFKSSLVTGTRDAIRASRGSLERTLNSSTAALWKRR